MTEISSKNYLLFFNAVFRLAIPSFVTTTSKHQEEDPELKKTLK